MPPSRQALLAALACLACLPGVADTVRIALASTLDDSGLGTALARGFGADTDCQLAAVATTSARGLDLLATGDVAAAVTHAPARERNFIAAHPGATRYEFAASEFVLVGPAADPAAVRGHDLPTALRRVAQAQAPFISRDDSSGTHDAETALWQAARGGRPAADWYRQVGGHMASTLWLADETGAYTLADTATLARLRGRGLRLEPLARDTPPLRNAYSVLLPAGAAGCASMLASWLRSAAGQALLAGFALDGEHPFRPLP